MAEAVAGETGKPYVFVDPGAFINMFMGVGVLKVKSLFRKLRKLSLRYGGVIVFFDEADSLGNRGIAQGGMPGGKVRRTVRDGQVPRLLLRFRERPVAPDRKRAARAHQRGGRSDSRAGQAGPAGWRDGRRGRDGRHGHAAVAAHRVVRSEEAARLHQPGRAASARHAAQAAPHYRILVMMASNMAESLDPALLRPGRIDRIYRVGYPSKVGRVRTFEGYLAKVTHELTPEQIDKIATITPYASGAKIKDLVNEALIIAIRDGRDVITYRDVIRAKQLKELGPPEDVEYIERERHAVAVHEACHAVLAYRTQRHMNIDLATIEKGADYLGMVKPVKPEDQYTTWRSEFEADIQVFLASLAGERMFFDEDNSSGVSGDLEGATTIAALMEGVFGMGQTVSSLSAGQRLQIGTPGGRGKGTQEDAEAIARRMLADRIEDNLSRLLEQTEETLRENEQYVLAVSHALETYKTLSGEDIEAIFEGQRGPLVDGTVYQDDSFLSRLREYHLAAKVAHHEHSKPDVELPVAEPVYAIADGYGAGNFFDGSFNGNGSGTGGGTGTEDVIDFGGLGNGNGNGSQGPLGAPTYDPPSDDSDND